MNRIGVFIDGGYFKEVLKHFGLPKISYQRLADEVMKTNEELLRTYYYDCPPYVSSYEPTEDELQREDRFNRFISAIQQIPRFETRLGRLQRIQTANGYNYIQKKVDVLLSVDLVRLACRSHIHRAIIIAGDSDLTPAIETAKDNGIIVTLMYYNKPSPHDELMYLCDEHELITNDLIDNILADNY